MTYRYILSIPTDFRHISFMIEEGAGLGRVGDCNRKTASKHDNIDRKGVMTGQLDLQMAYPSCLVQTRKSEPHYCNGALHQDNQQAER